ncbi:TetR/AcrR family transcriptional regulator [Microbaculum marinum]|uniref:TetR/AcrR family transcriptional regulator n=1 Tax=Microbaculum marinum TaxID=1764581 RepID=A0AAW9S1B9_9HYPH
MAGRKRIRNAASKELILEAAERVVVRDGPARLTLDSVAQEAGLSKGGLLYNFPTKQSLIEGMILNTVDRHRRRFDEVQAESAGAPNTAIAALIEARRAACPERSVGLALMAGLAENPALLSPLREETREALEAIRANSTDPMLATLLWLALGGLDFFELLDISPFPETERRELESHMAGLIRSAGSGRCERPADPDFPLAQ